MSEDRFVVDGYERLVEAGGYQAAEERSVVEVEALYAEALAKAGFLRRLALRLEMRREIARRLAGTPPPDALYFAGTGKATR